MRSSDFVIILMITDRIGLHSVLLPLLITLIVLTERYICIKISGEVSLIQWCTYIQNFVVTPGAEMRFSSLWFPRHRRRSRKCIAV